MEDGGVTKFLRGICFVLSIGLFLPNYSFADCISDNQSKSAEYCNFNLAKIRELAEKGDKEAQFRLGLKYEKGEDLPKNDNEAVKWYEKASNQGNLDARHNLAMKYRDGEGVNKDLKKAFELGKSAAEMGQSHSQNRLGVDYLEGVIVSKNIDESLKWFKKSANNDFSDAKLNLGKFHEYGWGGKVNYLEAFNWYVKAADSNNAESQYAICLMYKKGLGINKSNNDAYQWCKKAALNGHILAMNRTGAFEYSANPKSAENYKNAIYWWKKASDMGNVDSEYFLGLAYEALGNKVEANKWFVLAAKHGQKAAVKKLKFTNSSIE